MKLHAPSHIQRRIGEKLFLKAERDATPKSAMVRRPYPPGVHGRRRRRGLSEFGIELAEKQKVCFLYGLSDSQLKRFVRAARRASGRTATQALGELLERRLDNVVFRLGLAPSRRIARQLIAHGHILVNGRPARIASRLLRSGERTSVREASRSHPIFEGLAIRLKKHEPPGWLGLDPEAQAGEVRRLPAEEDISIPFNLSKVIEYYSR